MLSGLRELKTLSSSNAAFQVSRNIRMHIGYGDHTRMQVYWKSPFVVKQQELSNRLHEMILEVRSSPEELRRSKANTLLKEYENLLRKQKNDTWFKLEWPIKKKIVWAQLTGSV
eukprot:GDKJ01015735.1.p1 GENE.GDKJ01015735.1~~GDKJ01015735.1.p1  ORF type:complete len:114 (+),score=12.74 GDKJ01015735.1:41-382(+)